MTIGEHLEELRGCLMRSLLAMLAACLVCIWPAQHLLSIIARPVILALRHYGQPDTFLATSPTEAFLIYVKTVMIAGVILSGPYVIFQVWSFVAAGLYPRERAAVYRVIPLSVLLFFVGVAFMYFFVLLLSLKFLIGFSTWLPMPAASPTALERAMLGESVPAAHTQPALPQTPPVPVLAEDPESPETGALWFNSADHRLKLRGDGETFAIQLQRADARTLVTTHFRIGEYLTFVLMLTIAFGLAFQVPVVVVFFARLGIVPVEVFRKYRKVVILAIVIVAGAIAPPDLISHLLLSVPMIALFELGLLLAARKPRATPPDAA